MKLRFLAVLIISILLLGCAEPILDASSEENMRASLRKTREALPEAQRQEFDDAMEVLVYSQTDLRGLFVPEYLDVNNEKATLRALLDKKSGLEIIAKANALKRQRQRIEQQQDQEEIASLEGKFRRVAQATDQLQKIKILESRFYEYEQNPGRKIPVVELKIVNETLYAVSRIYFDFALRVPGNSLPMHKGRFHFDIRGGMKPGAVVHGHLAPPSLSNEEGSVRLPRNVISEVVVVRIDGPDGNALYSAMEFGEEEQTRLAELRKKYSRY